MSETQQLLAINFYLRERDGELQVVARSSIGQASGQSPLPSRELIDGFWSLDETVHSPEHLRPLGTLLGEALFCGDIADFVVDILAEGKERQEIVSFNLFFPPDQTTLGRFPWEIFCDMDGHFPVREGRVQVARCLAFPMAEDAQESPVSNKDPLLHVISCPAGMAPVEPLIPSAGTPRTTSEASFEQFTRSLLLERKRFSGFQFDGHCAVFARCAACEQLNFTSAGACHACSHPLAGALRISALAFERANGNVDWIPADEVGGIVYNAGLDYLALLACENAGLNEGRRQDDLAIARVSADLVLAGAPQIVVMQTPVSRSYAKSVMKEFYKALAGGLKVEQALTKARLAYLDGPWYSPGLYKRSALPSDSGSARYDSCQVDSVLPFKIVTGAWAQARLYVHRPASGAHLTQTNLRLAYHLPDTVGLKIAQVEHQDGLSEVGQAFLSGALKVTLTVPGCQVTPEEVRLFLDDNLDAPPAIFHIKAGESGPAGVRFELRQEDNLVVALNQQIEIQDQIEPGMMRLQVTTLSCPCQGEAVDVEEQRACPDCGMPNRLGVRFCRHCGAQLVSVEQAKREAGEITGETQLQMVENHEDDQDFLICPECNQHNLVGERFCRQCGASLDGLDITGKHDLLVCQECGHPNRSGVRFCRHCGYQLFSEEADLSQSKESEAMPDRDTGSKQEAAPPEAIQENQDQLQVEQVCPECGHTNRLGVRFCRHCGGQLVETEVIEVTKQSEEQDLEVSEEETLVEITPSISTDKVPAFEADEPRMEEPIEENEVPVFSEAGVAGSDVDRVPETPAAPQPPDEDEAEDAATMMMARCSDCGHPNPPEAARCKNCGADLSLEGAVTAVMRRCQDCGHPNLPDAGRCQNCGANLGQDSPGESELSAPDPIDVAQPAPETPTPAPQGPAAGEESTDVWSTLQMKRCHNCGHPNRPEARLCMNCGVSFDEEDGSISSLAETSAPQELCPECAASNPVNSPICQTCGASLDIGQKDTPVYKDQNADLQAESHAEATALGEEAPQAKRASLPPMPKSGAVRDVNLVYCRQCGYGNQPNAEYCQDCGEDLRIVAAVIPPSAHSKPSNSPERNKSASSPAQKGHSDPASKSCPACGYANPLEAVVCRQCNSLFEIPEDPGEGKIDDKPWWKFWS